MALSEDLERRFRKVLADRSVPGAVTDLDKRTLSDEDREAHMRAHLLAGEPETWVLGLDDEGILMEVAAGF